MTLALFAVGVLMVIALVIFWYGPLGAILNYRGMRLVTCPENGRPAAVAVDLGNAAVTALVDGRADVRLALCSRWPDRYPCDQACLSDVERDGRAGTVLAVARTWYAEQRCCLCGKATSTVGSGHEPALAGPAGLTTPWSAVSPELLPEAFATRSAVCWDCHIAESFRRAHPELVVDR